MASQSISPNNEDPSPDSVESSILHVQRNASNTAEDTIIHHDEGWSEEEGDEEGPKRKRARPLSVYSSRLLCPCHKSGEHVNV